ncbi:MAG: carbon-nitrogen hydrolase family protein [Pseudomonadales bacterium]
MNSLNTPDATKVALIQNCATADVDANMQRLDELVAEAAGSGATVIALPEAFAFIGPDKLKRAMLESLDADGTATPILDQCRSWARQYECHLLLGGFHERVPGEPPAANTQVHLLPDGSIAARYRKIHLFDVDLADGTRLAESNNTQPGSKMVLSQCPFGTLGLTICYDIRFPALYQRLAAAGAMAITVPAAFTQTTGAAHWHTLLRARAIETQCFILAAAQHGAHNSRRSSYGHSLIIDPWGETLAEGPAAADAVITATIDPARVGQIRAQMPCQQHHRPFD